MAQSQAELVKDLVDAGVHFGHRVSRWNPKMQPYIHGKRNMIHIIDVKETVKGLLRAKQLIAPDRRRAARTSCSSAPSARPDTPSKKKPSRCGMHYVSERWLGGTLTNFRTIRARLNRLEELEKLWETGQIETYSKKMKSTLDRETDKIKTNLEGIRRMKRMPGVMFIIDTRREHIAVKEAQQAGREDDRADRHRQRSGSDRPADPRQRRRDAGDRDDPAELADAIIEGKSDPPGSQGRRPGPAAPPPLGPLRLPRRGRHRRRRRRQPAGPETNVEIPATGGPTEGSEGAAAAEQPAEPVAAGQEA